MASHDASKLLNDERRTDQGNHAKPSPDATWEQQVSGRSTMNQLDIHGSQWQGRGRDQIQIVQEIPQIQFVQQGCRHVSGNAASGADGVQQQKP